VEEEENYKREKEEDNKNYGDKNDDEFYCVHMYWEHNGLRNITTWQQEKDDDDDDDDDDNAVQGTEATLVFWKTPSFVHWYIWSE